MSLQELQGDLIKLVFPSSMLMKGRCINKSLKLTIETIQGIEIELSEQGSHEVTSDFLCKFVEPCVVSKYSWSLDSGWLPVLLNSFTLGLRLNCLVISVNDETLTVLLSHLRSLRASLDFRLVGRLGFSFEGQASVLQAAVTQLSEMSSLLPVSLRTRLVYDLNQSSCAAASALFTSLCSCATWDNVDLSRNRLGPHRGSLLCSQLPLLRRLAALNLGRNRLGADGAAAAAAALPSLASTLTDLDLGWNDLGEEGGVAAGAMLAQLTGLTGLVLSHNQLGVTGPGLCEQLPLMIRRLNLRDNALGPGACAALSRLTRMEELNLAFNQMGPEGGEALAPMLARMPALSLLVLESNKLGPVAGAALGEVTARLGRLSFLNISDNNIGVAGGQALGRGLAAVTALTSLDAANNRLEAAGAEGLVSGLAAAAGGGARLSHLNLRSSGLGEPGCESLVNPLASLTSLASLNLTNNGISAPSADALRRRLPLVRSIET